MSSLSPGLIDCPLGFLQRSFSSVSLQHLTGMVADYAGTQLCAGFVCYQISFYGLTLINVSPETAKSLFLPGYQKLAFALYSTCPRILHFLILSVFCHERPLCSIPGRLPLKVVGLQLTKPARYPPSWGLASDLFTSNLAFCLTVQLASQSGQEHLGGYSDLDTS